MLLRVVLCLLCLLLTRAAHAQEDAAREAFVAGREAYDHGAFADALAHFERAYALQPKVELLYNVARAADSDGQPERAIDAYQAYLDDRPDADNADFVRARLAKMRALVTPRKVLPKVVEVEPPSAPVPPPRDEPVSHKRAWIWSSVGVLIAGGIVAGVLLATRERAPDRAGADAYVFVPGAR